MTLAQWLANLGAWWVQVAALVSVAAVVAAGLRLTLPRARLALWQALLVACLALPLAQPWLPAPTASALSIAPPIAARFDPARTPVDPEPPARSAVPAGQAVAALLVLGALARLGWLGLGLVRLARLRREAAPIDSLPAPIDRAIGLSGATATLALAGAVDGPVTFGLRRPVVVLPRGFLDLAPDLQTTVVCHELAHVRRRDWAWTVAESMVTAAFWFHPAVWWLVAEIQLAREAVIDREVVELTGARRPYVEALVYLAGKGSRPALAPAIPMLRRRHLARRMRLLLSEVPMSRTRLVLSLATIVCTLALAGRYTVRACPLVGPAPAPAVDAPTTPEPIPGVAAVQLPPATRLERGEPMPRKIKDVRPVYPDEAKKARVQGVVILEVTVETDGTVSDTKVLRSIPALDQAAADAVRQWRFENVPRRLIVTVTVNFKLDDEASVEPRPDRVTPPVKIGVATPGRVPPPVKLKDVRPVYPEEARQAGVEGVVIIQVTIAADGTVMGTGVIRSIPMLDKAALDAVRQWRFEPPGREVQFTVTTSFTLDEKERAAPAADVAAGEPRVDVRVLPLPRLVREVKPRYPAELLESGAQGTVEVVASIDTTGAVTTVTVVSGPEGFHQAAIDAVKQWRFEPPPAPTAVQIELTFTRRL